jgi:hypothetical protein
VPPFFEVGLIPPEVVDRCLHRFSRLFVGADGIDAVADHLQRLEGHHNLVVLPEIPDDHQNVFAHNVHHE